MKRPDITKGSLPDAHARVPVDRMAVRVISRGVRFSPQKWCNQGTLHSAVPPPMTTVRAGIAQDMTGMKFGRFTCIGLADRQTTKAGKLWVVRCACGRYSYRHRKAMMNPNNANDACEECRYLMYLQRQDKRRRIGKDPD